MIEKAQKRLVEPTNVKQKSQREIKEGKRLSGHRKSKA